jgi:hypothetical protein
MDRPSSLRLRPSSYFYTLLTEEGVAVMNKLCPVVDWQVGIGKDAYNDGCNLAQYLGV